jgi:sulfonate transport system substrate-binding protein
MIVFAACGSDGSAANTDPPSATAPAPTVVDTEPSTPSESTAPADFVTTTESPEATIPPGTVLRVGDQGQGLEVPLRLSGELDDLPYEVEFASFASGPLVNEAFAAGAIDLGVMGDTPALLSYAAGLDTYVVGIRASDGVGQTLVARDGSGVETLDDLAGKKIAWTTGTSQHGFVLRVLDSVGLTEDDVTQIDVPITDVANVLAAGQADVAVLYEVFRAPYVAEHPNDIELISLNDFVLNYLYLLGSGDAIEDPAKAAAIEDFVARLARSGVWVDQNQDEFIQAYYVEVQKQTPEYGRQAFDAQGFTEWVEIGGDAQAAQQQQADLFFEAGFLPEQVDLSPQFDPAITSRFTDAIQEALS